MIFAGNKSALACASVLLALVAQTAGHAMPSIALGVKGTPARSDVQRPSTAKPCGTINPATTLDTSTAIPVAADGTVTMNVQNFNAGADGSTSVSVQVDATGLGKSFVAGTVKVNGNPAPTKVETDKVVFTLPAGTKCTGGKSKNLCLVSVKTTAGFGACTVVSQAAAAAGGQGTVKTTTAAKATTTKAAAKTTTAETKKETTTKAATTKVTKTTAAASKTTTAAKDNKGTSTKAAAAKTSSAAKKMHKHKHHHHHKGKETAKPKATPAAAKAMKTTEIKNAMPETKKVMGRTVSRVMRAIQEELEAELARRAME